MVMVAKGTVIVRMEVTVITEQGIVPVLMDIRARTVLRTVMKARLDQAASGSVCVRMVLNVTDSQVTTLHSRYYNSNLIWLDWELCGDARDCKRKTGEPPESQSYPAKKYKNLPSCFVSLPISFTLNPFFSIFSPFFVLIRLKIFPNVSTTTLGGHVGPNSIFYSLALKRLRTSSPGLSEIQSFMTVTVNTILINLPCIIIIILVRRLCLCPRIRGSTMF